MWDRENGNQIVAQTEMREGEEEGALNIKR